MIFADTSFWVALYNRGDDRHTEARRLAREHAANVFLTTSHVRGESWTLLTRWSGHRIGVRFLDALAQSPRVRVVFVTEEMETDAERWLRRHDERPYSFVDATSFTAMRATRINDALTFDEDFTAAGFHSIPARGAKG